MLRSDQDSETRRGRATERHFIAALRRASVVRGHLVIAAVSGGPDSSALLLLLCHAAQLLGFRCEAAYFDHRIRAAPERAAELRAAEQLCATAAVPLHTGAAPVRSLAKEHGRSLEDEARVQRYHYLAQVAAERGARFVATGHTADDQVETILLHLLRGSGLLGLAGMRESSAWPLGRGPALIRPLLGLTRDETSAYVYAAGVTPHHDSENDSPRYARNRVRAELLPLLETFNPQVRAALLRLSSAAAVQFELLQALAAKSDVDAATDGGGQPALRASSLLALPAALRVELLTQGFARASGNRSGLTSRNLADLEALLGSSEEAAIDLPGGVRVRVSAGRLRFEPRLSAPRPAPAVPAETVVPIPGVVRFGGWRFETAVVPPGIPCAPTPLRAVLLASDAEAGLILRTRRPGDRMRLDDGRGHKKLQDVLADAKVPRSQRDALPLLRVGADVVWVPGVRAEERVRVVDTSAQRVGVTATRLP